MSTEDTTKLIEEARSYFLPGDEGSIEWRTVEALAFLVAENEKLRREIEFKRARVKGAVSDYEAECTRADRAEAERDAAQRIIESHTCGENVELAYRRTLDAQKERDALRAQLDNMANVIERIVDVANFSAIEGDDGFIWRYDMPPGPIHAAIKKLNELGHPVASIGRVRLNPGTKADLIEFARRRIQMVWDDAGPVDAQTLAENVVSGQEWLWLSLHFPVEVSE